MHYLFTDIETIPAQRPDVLEEIRANEQAALDAALANIRPPGQYKKQESIDEWMANEAPKQAAALQSAFDATVDTAYRKTGLDGAFGQVCVIGIALDEADPVAVLESDWENPDAERLLLETFGHLLNDTIHPRLVLQTCIVGHNVSAFDLRFIAQRSIVHGVQPHTVIARAAQAKPWETEKVFDTMVQWAGVGNRISLDKLCNALRLPRKGAITGADVWPMVQAGKIQEVADYCVQDVIKARNVFRRMTFRNVPLLEDVPA